MGQYSLKLGEFFFRYRGFTPVPLVVGILYFAHPTPVSFLWGTLLLLVGESIRIWGVSYAGGATRTRRVGAPQLVTNGPFAYVRNPLYIGNMIMYTGATVLANVWLPYLILVVWVYFGFQYYWIVRLEENTLKKLFGTLYEQYCHRVPRFIPRWRPYRGDNPVAQNLKKALRSERSTFLSFITILGIFFVKMLFLSQTQ